MVKPKNGSHVRREHLEGALIEGEACLVLVHDGLLKLTHLEARVMDENENYIGYVVFNGIASLPNREFTWHDVEDK